VSEKTETDFRGRGERILVVDDMRDQRDLARQLLESLGYAVATAASGEEAVEVIRSEGADLVILDMIMDPGIDGFDAYRRILDLRPGTKAIIASGFSEGERVRETMRLGAGEYIMKPYTLRKIGAAVRAELGRDTQEKRSAPTA
jgi:DNA-binding NtrC family response regulator